MANDQTNQPKDLTVETVGGNKQEEDNIELTLGPGPRSDPVSQPVSVQDNAMQSPKNSSPNLGLCCLGGSTSPNPRPNPKPARSSSSGRIRSMHLAVRRRRSNAKHVLEPKKSPTVQPPYRWATDRRAVVHTLAELESQGVETVVGDVQCKKCDKTFELGLDLKAEAGKLIGFMAEKKGSLLERSAPEWDTPAWRDCSLCGGKKCVKGVVARKKRSINWLFLFLGGFLCCCTLEQLRYFCKHTGNHRTGAKNRLLYLTYLGLCKQLDPSGPFNPPSF